MLLLFKLKFLCIYDSIYMIGEGMKNKKIDSKLKFIVVPIMVFIIFLSTAYAFFNDSLTINGVASTVDYYEGEKLPVSSVIRDSSNNRYYTQDIAQKGLNFSSESWQDDTYSLNMKKAFATSGGEYTINYTITFTNDTETTFTQGEVKTEITSNTGSMLKDANATISKTEVKPGESVDITMAFHVDISWRYYTEEAKATISYNVQGKVRNMYFIVKYTT